MLTTKSEKYLGDILSSDAKIDINVQERYNKGIELVNQIISILKEVSFGFYHFEMAFLFRSSMLVNGIMCSIEALYGLKSSHIEQLEQCDRMFMRKLFGSVSSTAVEAFYLEVGALPLRFTIIARRLMFFWNILQKSDDELVKQVYLSQKLSPVKNDWCLQIKIDMEYCKIDLTEEEIKNMKKEKFKNLVNTNVREIGREYLLSLKSQHSKSSGLNDDFKCQEYLITEKLSVEEKQLLFSFRNRTYECKTNYKNKYGSDLSCFVCKAEDSQQHLLQCELASDVNTEGLEYSDIFSSIDKQVKIVKALKNITSTRNALLKKSSISGSQEHS